MFFIFELFNGWSVCFFVSFYFDVEMNYIEFGIELDIKVDML